MKKSHLLSSVCAYLLIFVSVPSNAVTVSIDFTATVTNVNTTHLESLGSFVGVTGAGRIEYDMNPDQSWGSSDTKYYTWDSPKALFTFELPTESMTFTAGSGGTSISSDALRDVAVEINNDRNDYLGNPKDAMIFNGNRMTQTLEGLNTRMFLAYLDSTAAALTNLDLSNILNPSSYDSSGFTIMIDVGGGVTYSGLSFSVDSITVNAVPIPPAIWLFGTGLLGLIGISRRKK